MRIRASFAAQKRQFKPKPVGAICVGGNSHFALPLQADDDRPRATSGCGGVRVTVDDADSVHASVVAAGVPVDGEMRRMNWPGRGFNLRDPDNNAIHVEQPMTVGEPAT